MWNLQTTWLINFPESELAMNTNERHADIIAEARDKYTVHDCNECEYRKSCDLNQYGFNSDECKEKRQSIALVFGIEDEYFTKLLSRLEAANKRELSKNTSKNGADFGQLGDCAKLREALEKIDAMETPHNFQIERSDIADACYDLTRAIKLAHAALAAPARNCDKYATADEAIAAFADDALLEEWKALESGNDRDMLAEELYRFIKWLFATATEKEGGAK